MQNVNHDIQTSEHYNFFIFGVLDFFWYLELPTTREQSFALVFEFVQLCWVPICGFEQLQQSEVDTFVYIVVSMLWCMFTHPVATAQTSCVTSKVCANDSSLFPVMCWRFLSQFCVNIFFENYKLDLRSK